MCACQCFLECGLGGDGLNSVSYQCLLKREQQPSALKLSVSPLARALRCHADELTNDERFWQLVVATWAVRLMALSSSNQKNLVRVM